MRTREQSKAQLLRELARWKEIAHKSDEGKKELSEQIERLKEQKSDRDAQITLLRESLAKREQDYAAMKDVRDAAGGRVGSLREELRIKDQRIGDLLHEVRTWKDAFMNMQERMKQMRKNFYQQAALAGELADNAYATVAPTNTAEEAR